MHNNEIDTEERLNTFLVEIVEKREIFFFRLPETPNMIFASESCKYTYDDGSFLGVIPVWSTTYLPDAKLYGEGLILDKMEIEEFYYRVLSFMVTQEAALGINWDQNGIGDEILPMSMLELLAIKKSVWSSSEEEIRLYRRLKD